MLKIYCGPLPKNVLNSAVYIFNNEFKSEWFNDSLVEEMVLDVDLTKHFKDQIFESPVLGFILPERLSGGVKGLILILKSERAKKFSAYRSCIFGDNCVKWIAKLSFITDFAIYMSHPLDFSFGGNSNDRDFQSTPINAVGMDGEILSTCGEVADYYFSNDNVSYIEERYYTAEELESMKAMGYSFTMSDSDDMGYGDAYHRSDSDDSAASSATESEGYTSKCDYVIPIDSPFWEELDALYENVETIKPEEEEGLREEIRKLTALYKKR